MADFIEFVPGTHEQVLRELLTSYLEEAADLLKRELNFEEDIPAVVDDALLHLDQFSPPAGRLLMVVDGEAVIGCGCLRQITPEAAEIKRMYLRPAARGRGLGRSLLEELLSGAREQGYREVRLDTDGLMPAALAIYEQSGFTRCDPYPESEIPTEFNDRWVFMRRDLAITQ